MPTRAKWIALLLGTYAGYCANVTAGVGLYASKHADWFFSFWPAADSLRPLDLARIWKDQPIEGAIGDPGPEAIARFAKAGVPVVHVTNAKNRSGHYVGVDDRAVGRLAVDYFAEKAFKHIAFVGNEGWGYSEHRLEAVRQRAGELGRSLAVLNVLRQEDLYASLLRWLPTLPRPVAIIAANDTTAARVSQACRAVGMRVPEDAALLGVDNNEMVCQFTRPALSSIDTHGQRIGYLAAEMLDALMNGKRTPRSPVLVSPTGVVTRQSTDIMAVADPLVIDALHFIRENASSAISVQDVLDHVAVSRRMLERRFGLSLGRSPRSEIQRAHVERAKDLLLRTDLDIPSVADRCGYPRANHFTTMFRRETGVTPNAFRRQGRR